MNWQSWSKDQEIIKERQLIQDRKQILPHGSYAELSREDKKKADTWASR